MKMEKAYYTSMSNGMAADTGLPIIRHPSHYRYGKLTWFDIRVFYVRISNFMVADDSTPVCLTLNHIPLSPDTLLEINGSRCSIFSEVESSLLRRDRADKRTEEATFVSTDCVRLTGSVKFEVLCEEDLIISGVLEMPNGNGFSRESKSNDTGRWSINCNVVPSPGLEPFFKGGKQGWGYSDTIFPTIEVYVAGSSSGSPIILTKTLPLKKNNKMRMLNSIPEYDGRSQEHFEPGLDLLEVAEYRNYKPGSEDDHNNYAYWGGTEYADGDEDGEITWFNAGVRVGVGIGLGICIGVGIGVGVLIRSYQSTTRNFFRRRRFL